MAHIFRYASTDSPGLIVFTHKELAFFARQSLRPDLALRRRRFARDLERLARRHFIGIHWGGYAKRKTLPPWVSFNLAPEGMVIFDTPTRVIPISSGHFTPSVMRPDPGAEKYWDIICVAKAARGKRYDDLFAAVRRLYDMGRNDRVLCVVASNPGERSNPRMYGEMVNDYMRLFTAAERERFTLLKTDADLGFQGLSSTMIAYFLNRSRVFALFSKTEGTAKVVKEAQLVGLPVVVRADLRGAVLNFLNHTNSVSFDNPDTAHLALARAVDYAEQFEIDSEHWRDELGEDANLERLRGHFAALYADAGKPFDGALMNCDNLNRRLPAHHYDPDTVPWASDLAFRFTTTDITSRAMFDRFVTTLDAGSSDNRQEQRQQDQRVIFGF